MTAHTRAISFFLMAMLLACFADAAGTRVATERKLGSHGSKKSNKGGNQSNGSGESGNNYGNGIEIDGIPMGMTVVTSTKTFDDTYNDLVALLDANPNIEIIKEIDHSVSAARVGLDLAPNKVVFFGNPALGTPLMLQDQRVGLDLPQKMLVWEGDDGQVYLGYNSVDYLSVRHEAVDGIPQLDTIQGALANFASGASGVAVDNIMEEASMTPREQNNLKNQQTLRTSKSDFDFATTLRRLTAAIEASPANIALELDHFVQCSHSR